MALTFDHAALVIDSSASILDLPAFHAELRDWEDSEVGVIHPVTHTWRAVDLGSGAYFYALDLINGWQLRFPSAGNYTISGNLNGTIIPVAGVYVERKTSAAYATTAIGGSGPSAADIAALVVAQTGARMIEAGFSHDELLRIALAALAGTSQKAGSTITFKGLDGVTDRIVGSFDAENNRTGAILDGS